MSQTTTPSGADVDPLTVLDARIIGQRFALSAAIGAHGMAVAAEELRKAIEARTAVATLIARNAELVELRAALVAEVLTADAKADALAAENKTLREAMLTVRMSIRFKSLSAEQQTAIDAALARTPAKENDDGKLV